MAVDSISKQGSAQLTGHVTVSEGTGITLTQAGQNIEIARTIDTDFNSAAFTQADAIVTNVFTAGSTHTKGAWTQLCASAPFTADAFYLNLLEPSQHSSSLIDIGFGGAGSEVVQVSNLLYAGGSASYGGDRSILIPLGVPSGTRVSARFQATDASMSIRMMVILLEHQWLKELDCTQTATYGANTGTSLGTSVNYGNNVKGSWAELSAAIGFDAKWAVFNVSSHESFAGTRRIATDFGAGAAASETVILPDMCSFGSIDSDCYMPATWSMPVKIASGARIAARGEFNSGTVTATAAVTLFG